MTVSLEDNAMLESILEDLASSDDALRILESLSSAVFSSVPGLGQMTWSDAAPGEASPMDPQSAQERLRLAERRYRRLVEQIPAITFMVVLGEGENEIAVSPHIERVLGFSAEEWLADPFLWFRQLHPDDRETWHQEFARGCRTGGPWRGESRYLARDGTTKWIRGEAHLIRDEQGRPQVLQGVAYDITESKRAQEILMARAVDDAKRAEDLAIALRVQTSILPRDLAAPGYTAAALMKPAEHVGGDYYDFRPTDDGAWIAIGDVSGHGLDAGLVMLMTQSAVASLLEALPSASPSEIVVRLNEVLYGNIRERLVQDDHVTFTLLRCGAQGLVRYAGAHEDLLIYRRRTDLVEQVATRGTWLGARRGLQDVTKDARVRLEPGDVLLLHTDGVPEGMNAAGEQFGISRMREIFGAHARMGPNRVVSEVAAAASAWMDAQNDDISLVAVRHEGR